MATGNKYYDYSENGNSVRLRFIGAEMQPNLDLNDVIRGTGYQVYQAAARGALATGDIFELGINSAYRVPNGSTSPHPLGKAIDILYMKHLVSDEAGPHTFYFRDTQDGKLDFDVKNNNVNSKNDPKTPELDIVKRFSHNLFSENPGVVSQVLQPWEMAKSGPTSWQPNDGGNGSITPSVNPDNWLDALHRTHLHISINPTRLWNVY